MRKKQRLLKKAKHGPEAITKIKKKRSKEKQESIVIKRKGPFQGRNGCFKKNQEINYLICFVFNYFFFFFEFLDFDELIKILA